MATTTNVRMFHMAKVVNTENGSEKWININSHPTASKWATVDPDSNARSAIMDKEQGFYNENKEILLTGPFTIGLWLSFETGKVPCYHNYFNIHFENGSNIYCMIPGSIVLTTPRWYTITRNASNVLTIKIGNTTIGSFTNSAKLNLSANSFIFIGNAIEGSTGYTPIVDDIIIADSVLPSSLTVPTGYVVSHEEDPTQVDWDSDKYAEKVYQPIRVYY